MADIQSHNRCDGYEGRQCPVGKEGEVYFETAKSKKHIHPPFSSIRTWAEEVEKGNCTVNVPPYYLPRFQSPEYKLRPGSSRQIHYIDISSPSTSSRLTEKECSPSPQVVPKYSKSIIPPTGSPLRPQKDNLLLSSYPPTSDGKSIDDLLRYISWLQRRFPAYWDHLNNAETQLVDNGFVFKSIIKRENYEVVVRIGILPGIANMFIDEAMGYKRYRYVGSNTE